MDTWCLSPCWKTLLMKELVLKKMGLISKDDARCVFLLLNGLDLLLLCVHKMFEISGFERGMGEYEFKKMKCGLRERNSLIFGLGEYENDGMNKGLKTQNFFITGLG